MQQLLACLFCINIEFIDENNKINLKKKKRKKLKFSLINFTNCKVDFYLLAKEIYLLNKY